MSLTPQDIQSQQFNVRFRGFDIEEVDSFLEQVAEEFLLLSTENQQLREKATSLSKQIEQFNDQQKTFQNAIISTQRIADELMTKTKKKVDEIRDKTRSEAEKILVEAKKRAEKVKTQAEAEISTLMLQIDNLNTQKKQIRDEITNMLHGYLKRLDEEIDKNFAPDSAVIAPPTELGVMEEDLVQSSEQEVESAAAVEAEVEEIEPEIMAEAELESEPVIEEEEREEEAVLESEQQFDADVDIFAEAEPVSETEEETVAEPEPDADEAKLSSEAGIGIEPDILEDFEQLSASEPELDTAEEELSLGEEESIFMDEEVSDEISLDVEDQATEVAEDDNLDELYEKIDFLTETPPVGQNQAEGLVADNNIQDIGLDFPVNDEGLSMESALPELDDDMLISLDDPLDDLEQSIKISDQEQDKD